MSGQQERLESWKQIAAYLGKSERTVRRWQQTEGMPVHRHQHQQRGSVWAYAEELDAWLASRKLSPEPLPEAPGRTASTYMWVFLMATIAVATSAAVWILRPVPVRSVRLETVPLTSMPGAAYGPSISPDGRRVAFQWAPSEDKRQGIYLKDIGKEAMWPLREAQGWEFLYGPSWSPDGRRIAYIRRVISAAHSEGSQTWLHVISSGGGEDRSVIRLSSGPLLYANHMHLSWTPDSTWIAAPFADEGRNGIYLVSPDSGETRRLTVAKQLDYGGQLSPDGRTLVFLRQEGPPGAALESVWRQDIASGGVPVGAPKLLYQGRSQASGIAWTPSGKDLVFCNSTNAFFGPFNSRLFLLHAQPGREPALLDSSDCSTVAIAKTGPSGKPILVYASGGNQKARIYVAGLESLSARQSFAATTRFDGLPSFSPDGRQVAFLSNRDGVPEIWAAAADGTETRKLTSGGNVWSGPRWSPDGQRLVYGAARAPGSAEHALFVLPAAGGKPERIPLAERYASNPFWSQDGEHIYYWAYDAPGHPRALWRVRPGGGNPQFVGRYPANFQQQSLSVGKYIYYARNVFPYVLARIPLGGGEDEAVAEMLSPYFAAAAGNIYYVRPADRVLCAKPISGGEPRQYEAMPVFRGPRGLMLGIAVSPAADKVVWSVTGLQQLDLEMVTDFRL